MKQINKNIFLCTYQKMSNNFGSHNGINNNGKSNNFEKSKNSSFFERFKAAGEYVQALQDLPPNFETGSDCGFNQYIPDPVSRENIKMAQENVVKKEQAFFKMNNKN